MTDISGRCFDWGRAEGAAKEMQMTGEKNEAREGSERGIHGEERWV